MQHVIISLEMLPRARLPVRPMGSSTTQMICASRWYWHRDHMRALTSVMWRRLADSGCVAQFFLCFCQLFKTCSGAFSRRMTTWQQFWSHAGQVPFQAPYQTVAEAQEAVPYFLPLAPKPPIGPVFSCFYASCLGLIGNFHHRFSRVVASSSSTVVDRFRSFTTCPL
jgi:hypothetical protein